MFARPRFVLMIALVFATSLSLVTLPHRTWAEEEPQPVNIGDPLGAQQGSGSVEGDTIDVLQGRFGDLLETMLRGLAVLSLLPIVVGGFQLIISQGNEDKITRGKQTLYFGIVGLVLALLAIAVFRTLLTFILG